MSDLPPPGIVEKVLTKTKRGRAIFELTYPFAIGAIASFSVWRIGVTDAVYDAIIKDVLPTAISVSAILAGFQGAGQAVLLGILDSSTIDFLKRTGHFKSLVSYLWRAILLLLVASSFALLVLVFHATGKPAWMSNAGTLAALAGLHLWAAACSYRINRLMFKVLIMENKGQNRPPTCQVSTTKVQ